MTIYELVQTALLILIALSIISQLPHTYYIFISASKLADSRAKQIQAGAFCLIASLAIFLFIYIDPWLAFFAALIEAIFNIYYYTDDYWQSPRGMETSSGNRKSRKKLFRTRWIYFFISVLIPAFMFIFGYLLKNLDRYL
jgi:hypothetical protein